MEVPIQVINLDGSHNASYFQDRVSRKLEKYNFLVVNHNSPFKLLISDFEVIRSVDTQWVTDDCDGYASYELEDEHLYGWVELKEDNRVLLRWRIEAANVEVLREGDPFLIELLFPDDGTKNCTDYYVKSKCTMDNDLRACARQIAADAAKEINKLY